MNVGLLTIHDSVSPGASLQACALYAAIKDLGYDVATIDYCPSYFPSRTNVIKPLISQGPKGVVKAAVLGRRLKAKGALFTEFAEATCPVGTRRYKNFESLKADPPMFDAVVCGSDQIWNPPHVLYDNAWFLSFYEGQRPLCVSYAASIGKDSLNSDDLAWLKNGVKNFDFIGVREDVGVSVLQKEGIHASQCVDPTLLWPRDFWESLERRPEFDIPENYVFYFPLSGNPLEAELVKAVSSDFDAPVVSAWSALKKLPSMDIQIPVFGPREFLWLINHAQVVVTNSFHGLVFSVIFKKKLISYKCLTRNSRLDSLLRLLDADSYQVSSMEEYRNANWDDRFLRLANSGHLLEKEIQASKKYLSDALKGERCVSL